MITGYISGQELRLSTPALAADSIKYLEAEFHFAGHDWDGYAKTAYFINGESKIALTLTDDRISADMGLNLTEGEWEVKLSGVKDGSRITTTTKRIYVNGFGGTGGALPDVTATQAEQLQGQIGNLSELRTSARASLVAAINEAAESGGGTGDHTKLKNRDAAEQHPMNAITGLTAALDNKQPKGDYLTADTLQEATDTALAQAKASGEFDGAAGKPGADGKDGTNGIVPTIGDNGNWYLDTTDTGKPSRGAKGDKGDKGADGAGMDVTGASAGQIVKISTVDGNGKPTAWEAVDMPSGGDGLTDAQISALDGLFAIAAYTSDPTAAYKAFRTAFGLPVVTMYSITNSLTNAATSNSAASVAGGKSYSATITAEDGYTLSTVTVTMGGTDITSTTWDADAGVITIAQVTGDVVITATAISDAGWTKDVPYDIAWIEGKFVNSSSDGSVVDAEGYACSDYLPCDGLKFVYAENVTKSNSVVLACFDENKTFIPVNSSIGFISNDNPVLAPLLLSAKYFRVNKKLTDNAAVTPKVLPVIDETTVPVAGQEYAPVVLMGKSVWNNTGVEADTTYANSYCTDFCFCYGFATITLNKKVRSIVNFYDAEKNYLSQVTFNTATATANIPEGAKYFRYDNGGYTKIWPSVILQEATE